MEEHKRKLNLSKNILFERLEFNRRCQQSEETLYNFLEGVRKLADSCDFHVKEKELLIRDRFICGLNDEHLQSRIVATGGNPDIDDVFEMCCEEDDTTVFVEPLVQIKTEPPLSDIGDDDDDYQDFSPEDNSFDEHDDSTMSEDAASSSQLPRRLRGPKLKYEFDYRCPVCDKFFKKFSYFKGHLVEHAIEKKINYKGKTNLNCYFCGRNYQNYDRLIVHLCSHSRKGIALPKVKCTECGMKTAVRYARQHRLQHITNDPKRCNKCGKLFPTVIQLNRHKKIHSEFKRIVCEICNREFNRELYLRAHKRNIHPELDRAVGAIECIICKQQHFGSISELKLHLRDDHDNEKSVILHSSGKVRKRSSKHSDEKSSPADLETKESPLSDVGDKDNQQNSFAFNLLYNQLIDGSKPENPAEADQVPKKTRGPKLLHEFDYRCPVCDQIFNKFSYIKGHLVEHAIEDKISYKDKQEFKCYFCGKDFKDYDRLIIHFCSHSRKGVTLPKVKCPECGLETAVRYARQHRLQHIAEDQKLCTDCGKLFPTVIQLNRHKKIHTEFKRLICDICNKEFNRELYLQTHKRTAHPDLDPRIEAVECFACKKRFCSILALKRHFQWCKLALEKKVLCMQCGMQFRNPGCLTRHLMREDHNGAHMKKFRCSTCGLYCYDVTQLNRHVLTHTDSKPFACHYPNCTKTYRTSRSLNDHLHTHTGEKSFHCKLCDYKCSLAVYLKKHMLVHTGRVKKNKAEQSDLSISSSFLLNTFLK